MEWYQIVIATVLLSVTVVSVYVQVRSGWKGGFSLIRCFRDLFVIVPIFFVVLGWGQWFMLSPTAGMLFFFFAAGFSTGGAWMVFQDDREKSRSS